MRKRKGQALIIVVIIIAIVMAVFAHSLTTAMRYHAREETEIYQREQALYLAEMGINQMIFNMNNCATYIDGDQISGNAPSGIGGYTTTYHTTDNFEPEGDAYIESTGTVGEVERTVFASIELAKSEAFKYCLFSHTGGDGGVYDDGQNNGNNFENDQWGSSYKYNSTTYAVPRPDEKCYIEYADEPKGTFNGNTYHVVSGDLGHVIYIKPNSGNTLTIDFGNISDDFSLSIVTKAKKVTIKNLPSNVEWSGAKNHNDKDKIYPVIAHLGTGTLTIDYSTALFSTLTLDGFVYTGGHIKMKYIYLFGWWLSSGEFDGEVMEGDDPGKKLGGGHNGKGTKMIYPNDEEHNYYKNPPPHFIIPGKETKVLPGTFREEY